jgi:hypothetical protein
VWWFWNNGSLGLCTRINGDGGLYVCCCKIMSVVLEKVLVVVFWG